MTDDEFNCKRIAAVDLRPTAQNSDWNRLFGSEGVRQRGEVKLQKASKTAHRLANDRNNMESGEYRLISDYLLHSLGFEMACDWGE